MHAPPWCPGKSPLWLWEGSLRLSSHRVQGCACQSGTLLGQIQGPTSCTMRLCGYPVLWWLLPAHLGTESQWSDTDGGHFFQWPACSVPVVTDPHFFPSTAHIPLHSAHSPCHRGLASWYPEGRFGHLVGSAASSVSQYVPSPHEIGEESIWQSSSKPHHCGQNSMTWAGRHRRCRAPGWSGRWWRPPSTGGSSSAPARGVRSSRRVADKRQRWPVTGDRRRLRGAGVAAGTLGGRRALSGGEEGWLWVASRCGGWAAGPVQALLKQQTGDSLRSLSL